MPKDSNKGRSRRGQKGRGQERHADRDVRQMSGALKQILDRLPDTQREVLEYRMGLVDGHAHNLAETARKLGLTQGEVKEIGARAFEHIREAVPLDRLQQLLPEE